MPGKPGKDEDTPVIGQDTPVIGQDAPVIGQIVPGYSVPVINERAVRAAAGLLMLSGGIAYAFAIAANSGAPLKPFGIVFMADMLIRVTAGDRYSPSLALGRVIVRRQKPEWVGASQKAYAWWFGVAMAMTSCFAMGYFGAPFAAIAVLCGFCLAMLFMEASFGICVGCTLQRVFDRRNPTLYCPGGACRRGGSETEHDAAGIGRDVADPTSAAVDATAHNPLA
ncbi:MAG: DUF4395 domain-containing protein [Ancrocorticia sp.]|jgi:hypothetical protein|nr:DUF4395 domain-containing protein [Ancrocorticia sp.]MCI2193507.1 DUF4395 domain-containing protein [Ancrocorticia sp.]MCI2199226.1 DUF4395 domain-containing protein [Ancrocorticia sp.]